MNDLLEKLEAAIKGAELLALRASTRRAGSDYRGVALNVEHGGPYDHGLPGEEWIGVFGQILEPVGIHAVNARDSLVATVGHPDVARHVVHNDPKRVLRRVARDRQLIELAKVLREDYQDNAADHLIRLLAEDYEIEMGS